VETAAINNVKKSSNPISFGNTLYVGGTGPGNYTKIQDAIDNVSDGDTVFVYDDSSPYKELVVINKSINFIGEDKNTTIIDGDYKGTVVDIQEDNVLVSGFTMINIKENDVWEYNAINIVNEDNIKIIGNKISTGHKSEIAWRAGIYLKYSSNNLIKDNIIYDGEGRSVGIMMDYNSQSNNISYNEIYGYVIGINVISNENTFYGNHLHNNYLTNIQVADNGGNIIVNNVITDSLGCGIDLRASSNNIINNNIIDYNGNGDEFDCGISSVLSSKDNIITNNHISYNNPSGIYLLSENNDISDNQISDNEIYGIYASFEYNSVISRNNLINNPTNVYFLTNKFFTNNRWSKNYYDDYNGRGLYLIRGALYFIIFTFNWINIDWRPAREPYDLEI